MSTPPQPPSWHHHQQQYYAQYTVGYQNGQYGQPNYPRSQTAQYPGAAPPAYPSNGASYPHAQAQIPTYPTWNPAHYPVAPYTALPLPEESPSAKRPKVEFRCDTCDLTLDSEIAHKAHVDSHTTCQLCKYVASPKLVKAHYQSVHGKFSGTGFKNVTIAIPGCPVQRFKICVGDNPEDIGRWIAERRRRFPRTAPPPEDVQVEPRNTLGNLLDGYGSSSSDEAVPTKDQVWKPEGMNMATTTCTEAKVPPSDAKPNNNKTRICRFFQRNGTCRNGDNCNFRHDAGSLAAKTATSRTPQDNRRRQTKTKTSSTLLRKLLKTDEARETVLTLQLLRYIVDCNYLQEQRESK